jgi:hypothetical protein
MLSTLLNKHILNKYYIKVVITNFLYILFNEIFYCVVVFIKIKR